MKIRFIKLLATFFGIGYLPFFPGTWATIVGIAIFLLLKNSIYLYLTFVVTVTCVAFIVAGKAEKIFDKKDSSYIVIDEVLSILLLCFFIPRNNFSLVLAFFMFRAFDIIKPFPINKIENYSGSYGIIFDDLVAACYACIGVWLFQVLIGGVSG